MGRDEAYRIVQEEAQRAWDTGTHLRELLARRDLGLDLDAIFDPRATAHLALRGRGSPGGWTRSPRGDELPGLPASKARPGTRLSCSRSASPQRRSGAPVMNQPEPLSATISP